MTFTMPVGAVLPDVVCDAEEDDALFICWTETLAVCDDAGDDADDEFAGPKTPKEAVQAVGAAGEAAAAGVALVPAGAAAGAAVGDVCASAGENAVARKTHNAVAIASRRMSSLLEAGKRSWEKIQRLSLKWTG